MEQDIQLPRLPKERRPWLLPLLALLLLCIFIPALSNTYIDWLWFRELKHTEIYWILGWGRWLLVGIVALFFFCAVFGNVYLALRRTSDSAWFALNHRLSEQSLNILDRTLRRLVFWGSGIFTFFFALSLGSGAANSWPQFLLYFHAQPTGTLDPVLHHDLSFYLFQLPVLEMVSTGLTFTVVVALIMTGAVYLVTGAIRMVRTLPVFAPAALTHLSLLLALFFLAKGLGYYIGRYSLFSIQTGAFVGPGYTDVHARIPDLLIMTVAAVFASLLMFINLRRRSVFLPLSVGAVMIILSLLLLGIYPAFLQRFRVDPTELKLEQPFLRNHIQFTRQAYGLDHVQTVELSPSERVSSTDLASAPLTVKNIRLWDHEPLLQNYQQRQGLRTYYEFHDVDIDRYQIGGQMRQVMLSARELNSDKIPGDESWMMRHLIYTHGYGVTMSPVNAFDPDKGEPLFFINNIPPQSTEGAPPVTRPEIYFGEQSNDYSIVRSGQKEFDYPGDTDLTNQYVTYQGHAGISLNNPLVRALMALRFNSLDLLISGYLTPQSRILMRRGILERAQALAPFFSYEHDPYIVIGTDGHLYWMLDAYTSSDRYPYAAHANLNVAGDGAIDVNYLRNPVKVVVDAYNGDLSFYVTDAHEPFVCAWRTLFPHLFKDISAMPAGLSQHVRVPEGMFDTISDIYRSYHMTDPTTFYQREDMWDLASETSGDTSGQSSTAPMEAYYLVMSLPGHSEPEYLLIRPYTPSGKQNMVAWLSARNDPGHLGELLVFNFPKQRQINGPDQILAAAKQNTEISQGMSLWGQKGSTLQRGNLLVIPVAGTILYVQPLYLLADQSQIPELKRVIVADQHNIVMRNTLEEALAALTGGNTAAAAPPAAATTAPAIPNAPPAAMNAQQQALQRSALDHFHLAQDALHHGDWTTYGKEMDQVGRDLEKLNEETGRK